MAKERPPLEEMTLRQLRKVASSYSVSRYSRMRKSQLLAAIQEIERSTASPSQSFSLEAQETVEAAKFELGQEDRTGGTLADVDEGIGELPNGYGESRIVLMPRDPQWAYTYWDVPNDHKEELRRQGGQQLALRIFDVTDINLEYQSPHSIQEYPCDELAREWYLPIPVSDRDYVIDIGYRCADGRWLVLARSAPVHVPPVYPSDWIEDVFITVNFEEDLRGKTFYELVPPAKKAAAAGATGNAIYDQIFGLAESAEAQRVAGSLFGSMQHVPGSVTPEQAISSYVFPSGVGMWAVPTVSGLTMSGVGMSGVGFSASAVPVRPRQFWLIADAELIVYGATEPDATVTIGGRPIKLNPDGTFRFQMSFQDGLIDYPIMAVAADGEQTRSIHMKFNRETPSRNTNTKEEAVLEWLG
ncbi:Rho termination protein [Westiellopsis prolifica IICB1]|nr:Rho termination protein [Westiellopsis prolifica IICB1]